MRLFFVFLLQLSVATIALAGSSSKPKPNIVFIVLDDLDYLVSAPYLADAMPFTHQLMKDHGIEFTQAHSAAICCEARAAILTGRLSHNNGVFTNGGQYGGYHAFRNPQDGFGRALVTPQGGVLDNEGYTMARYLHDAGYRTLFYGKYMNGFEIKNNEIPAAPRFWDEGSVFVDAGINGYKGYGQRLLTWKHDQGHVEKFGYGVDDYSTDVLTRKVLASLGEADRASPFFLYLTYTAPHLPIPPAPRHAIAAKKWRNSLPTDRPNFFADGADGFADKAHWLQTSLEEREAPQIRRFVEFDWQQRLGSLLAVDEGVHALWNQLQKSGQLDNTLFIITSDNGYNLGAHSLIHKMAPYEESIRVPLWVVGGSSLKLKKGVVNNHWIQHVDHFATILDYAGAKPEIPVDGRSYQAQLVATPPANTPMQSNKLFFAYQGEYVVNGVKVPAGILAEIEGFTGLPIGGFLMDIPTHMAMKVKLATSAGVEQSWKIIYWPKKDSDLFSAESWDSQEWELYDLTRDPYEVTNLAYQLPEECRSLLANLQGEMTKTVNCHGFVCQKMYFETAINRASSNCRAP